MKIAYFMIILRKNKFLSIFYTQNDNFSVFEACSHYYVIVRSYINGWYLFWYQWKEDVHTFTLVVHLELYDLRN